MAETKTAANPRSRARGGATTAARAKPAANKAVAEKTAEPTDAPVRVAITLGAQVSETKNYAKFDLAKDDEGNDTGMAGNLYAPLGTEEVRVALIGPASAVAGE